MHDAILLDGAQNVSSGGVEQYSQVSGRETIFAGGSGASETIDSGGDLIVLSGGVDSASRVANGGHEAVSDGGADYLATVASGGFLSANSLADQTTVERGGVQLIFSGGVDDFAQIYGKEKISGGLGYLDTVYSGGTEQIYNGITSGAVIFKGGGLVVSSGGTVAAATLAGGALTVYTGGRVSGGLTISSGRANIAGGEVATGQSVVFSGSAGVLALYDWRAFTRRSVASRPATSSTSGASLTARPRP